MDELQRKFKQREALENAYTNFVESYVNQFIEVKWESLSSFPVNASGFYCTSGWLLLTLVYCLWVRCRQRK